MQESVLLPPPKPFGRKCLLQSRRYLLSSLSTASWRAVVCYLLFSPFSCSCGRAPHGAVYRHRITHTSVNFSAGIAGLPVLVPLPEHAPAPSCWVCILRRGTRGDDRAFSSHWGVRASISTRDRPVIPPARAGGTTGLLSVCGVNVQTCRASRGASPWRASQAVRPAGAQQTTACWRVKSLARRRPARQTRTREF